MHLSDHKIQIINLKGFTWFSNSLIPNVCSLWISFSFKRDWSKMACTYHYWPKRFLSHFNNGHNLPPLLPTLLTPKNRLKHLNVLHQLTLEHFRPYKFSNNPIKHACLQNQSIGKTCNMEIDDIVYD